MAKLKFKIGGKTAKELSGEQPTGGGARYAGPTPPRDVYKGKLRFFSVRFKDGKPQENRNGDMMLRGAVMIDESGSKKRYNGYLINFNQNISDQGIPYINQMLDAISGGSEDYRLGFWSEGVSFDEKGNINKVGNRRYADNDVMVVVSAKDDSDLNGNRTLTVGAWLLPTAAEPDDDEELEEDIDTDDVDDIDDIDDEEEDDEEELEEDDEDEEDEDEEDEDAEGDVVEFDAEARREELTALSRVDLISVAKGLKVKTAKRSESEIIEDVITLEEQMADEPPF